jgi:hypothetical protein
MSPSHSGAALDEYEGTEKENNYPSKCMKN